MTKEMTKLVMEDRSTLHDTFQNDKQLKSFLIDFCELWALWIWSGESKKMSSNVLWIIYGAQYRIKGKEFNVPHYFYGGNEICTQFEALLERVQVLTYSDIEVTTTIIQLLILNRLFRLEVWHRFIMPCYATLSDFF